MTTIRSVSLPVIFAGGVCTGLYFYMSQVSDDYAAAGFADAAIVYGGAGVITAALVAWLRFFEPRLSDTHGYRPILLWALFFGLLFRLLGVVTFPVLEDDIYRYLWDGRMFVQTGSPYGVAPADFFASSNLSEHFETILDGVNHPGLATVYGPTLQLAFGLSYLIAPGAIWPLQSLFALADVLVLLILLRVIPQDSRPHLFCWLLYAWSPLLIKEFATTAHPDVLGVLFVLVAFVLRKGQSSSLRLLLIGFLLALAVGVKPFALVIAPFLIGLRLQAMIGFALGILLITLPFAGFDPVSAQAVWLPEGLQAMGQGWFFNAGLYELAYALGFVDLVLLQRIGLGVFALVWGLTWINAQMNTQMNAQKNASRPSSPVILLLFGLFLLVLPALNPWYLAWWLPFAVMTPCVTPWVASFVLLLSYTSGINVSSGAGLEGVGTLYQVPGWALCVEFGLIALALSVDLRMLVRRRRRG